MIYLPYDVRTYVTLSSTTSAGLCLRVPPFCLCVVLLSVRGYVCVVCGLGRGVRCIYVCPPHAGCCSVCVGLVLLLLFCGVFQSVLASSCCAVGLLMLLYIDIVPPQLYLCCCRFL